MQRALAVLAVVLGLEALLEAALAVRQGLVLEVAHLDLLSDLLFAVIAGYIAGLLVGLLGVVGQNQDYL